MQRNGEVHLAVGHILHDECINTYGNKLACQTLGIAQFALVEYCIEGHKDLYAKEVGIVHHTCYLLGRVGRSAARTEVTSTDIDSIGTTLDGGNSCGIIACWREQLYLSFRYTHSCIHTNRTKILRIYEKTAQFEENINIFQDRRSEAD